MGDKINPGVRVLVAFLRSHNFKTVDSGDGKTHDYGCDRDHPYVTIKTDKSMSMEFQANYLKTVLERAGVKTYPVGPEERPQIQLTYDPVDETAFIDLIYVDDSMLGVDQ